MVENDAALSSDWQNVVENDLLSSVEDLDTSVVFVAIFFPGPRPSDL
jgi:hypothetical protein